MQITKTIKPNLFIPGAGKSGTSSMHKLLDFHPKICMSNVKEPHFWTKLNFEQYTDEDHLDYTSLFDHKTDSIYFGESSTGYMVFPSFINRIKENYIKEPKFIFVLRNPIDRCYSHYWWLKGMGSEKLDLKAAFLKDMDVEPRPEVQLPEANYKCYYQYGLYAKWLKKFYENFDAENIKIITLENLKKNRLKTLNECFEFLNLEALEEIPEIHSNKTQIMRIPFLFKYAKLITFNKIKMPQIVKDNTPNKVKIYIRKRLMSTVLKHTKTNKVYPQISDDERLFLTEYYQDPVNKLKLLTGLGFIEWADFNT
jgi:hypothetical protein